MSTKHSIGTRAESGQDQSISSEGGNSSSSHGSSSWGSWLESSLLQLQQVKQLRMLRPTEPTCSSSQADINTDDLSAWLSGARAPSFIPPPQVTAAHPHTNTYNHASASQGHHGSSSSHGPSSSSHTHSSTTHAAPGSSIAADSRSNSQVSSSHPLTDSSRMHSSSSSLQPLVLFSLNDYLGLASHQDVCAAASLAAARYGMGPRSSMIVAGYTSLHRELECSLARLKATEDCLLTPTGFAANMAVMSSLASADDVTIFSDELNHASIIDGARLASRSGGKLQIYRHNDVGHLEQLLCHAPSRGRKLVVTDSLFSMDGDFADLPGLVDLKRKHDFLLVVDEAHGTLVCGEHGGGAAEAMGLADQVDIHVGTLSKAFGALGGFIACKRSVKDYLINRGRAFVYSTSLPVPVVAAASAALRAAQTEPWRQAHVWRLTQHIQTRLGLPALSPIVPLVIGPEADTLALSHQLLQAGMHVPAIRPPTVPPGTCRLRVSLTAAHSMKQIDDLCDVVLRARPGLMQLQHMTGRAAELSAMCNPNLQHRASMPVVSKL